MEKRFLYLDTFAIVRVASNAALAAATRTYIEDEGFVLVVGVVNLMELVSWKKRWSEVVSLYLRFLSVLRVILMRLWPKRWPATRMD